MSNKLNQIKADYEGYKLYAYEDFDNCVIGYDFDFENIRIIYSVKKMIKKLMKEYDFNELEAIEYFEYNFRRFRTEDKSEPILCQDNF